MNLGIRGNLANLRRFRESRGVCKKYGVRRSAFFTALMICPPPPTVLNAPSHSFASPPVKSHPLLSILTHPWRSATQRIPKILDPQKIFARKNCVFWVRLAEWFRLSTNMAQNFLATPHILATDTEIFSGGKKFFLTPKFKKSRPPITPFSPSYHLWGGLDLVSSTVKP